MGSDSQLLPGDELTGSNPQVLVNAVTGQVHCLTLFRARGGPRRATVARRSPSASPSSSTVEMSSALEVSAVSASSRTGGSRLFHRREEILIT